MLNALWATMIIIGIITGIATGHIEEVSSAFMDSAGEAVALCITMLGVMSMWTGILKIAECSGLLKKMTGWMIPVIRFLFPKIPEGHPAVGYIATNFAANILGLGWAATPAGLKAMEELEKLNSKAPYRASNEMCNFLIINISSLQLIPVSIIAYRSQYGSAHPSNIIVPAIAATAISTGVAILFCKMMDVKKSKRYV